MKTILIILTLLISGCVMPGKYIKTPGVKGTIEGVEANWVGIAIGRNDISSCTNPDSESIVSNGSFNVGPVKSTRLFGMPVPASCGTDLNLCFKTKNNKNYKWKKQITVDCNSIYMDYSVSCTVTNSKLICNSENEFRKMHNN